MSFPRILVRRCNGFVSDAALGLRSGGALRLLVPGRLHRPQGRGPCKAPGCRGLKPITPETVSRPVPRRPRPALPVRGPRISGGTKRGAGGWRPPRPEQRSLSRPAAGPHAVRACEAGASGGTGAPQRGGCGSKAGRGSEEEPGRRGRGVRGRASRGRGHGEGRGDGAGTGDSQCEVSERIGGRPGLCLRHR